MRSPGLHLRELCDALALDPALAGDDLRICCYLMSRLNFSVPMVVNQKEIVTVLSMKKEHVSRCMKKIADAGVIVEGPEKSGRSSMWTLNPDYGK